MDKTRRSVSYPFNMHHLNFLHHVSEFSQGIVNICLPVLLKEDLNYLNTISQPRRTIQMKIQGKFLY